MTRIKGYDQTRAKVGQQETKLSAMVSNHGSSTQCFHHVFSKICVLKLCYIKGLIARVYHEQLQGLSCLCSARQSSFLYKPILQS